MTTAAPLVDADENMDLGVEEVTVTSNGAPPVVEAKDVGDLLADMLEKVTAEADDLSDDIMILDDDEDMERLSLSDKKAKPSIEVDENELLNSEDKENISRTLKRLSRKELEDLVLVKAVEAIVKHSQAGRLRSKVSELQTQKDKMFQRVGGLQKQVQEMSKALKVLIDNHNRDPNGLNPNGRQKTPPIKFYRSVGLQVAIEAPYRNGLTKVIHVNESPINGFKPVNTAVYNVASNLNSSKRGLNQVSVENVIRQVQQGNSVRVVNGQTPKSRGSYGNGQQIVGIVNNNSGQSGTITSTTSKTGSNNITGPTVVDLTDDSNVITQTSDNGNVIIASNGKHYRVINPTSQGVQILQSNQSYQIVTSAQQGGQVRPILLSHNVAPGMQSHRQPQAMTFRNVAPRLSTPTAVQQTRPLMSQMIRPVSSAPIPRIAATIGTMVRAPIQPVTPKKFVLPPLPPCGVVSVPRGRVLKELPPQPKLSLNEQDDGIVLSWNFKIHPNHAEIASYQIYACQESLTTSSPGKVSQWKKVGDVKALPLPMACTLSQFTQGNRYFFIVRAVDIHSRTGSFCEPMPIKLEKRS